MNIVYPKAIIAGVSLLLLLTCESDTTQPPVGDENEETPLSLFEPADGECLFILGQASESHMRAYMSELRPTPTPAGFAFYTSLSDGAIQSDLPRYKSFMDAYPNTVLQLAIWTGERDYGQPGYYLDQIRGGVFDANIESLASACKEFNKPIFLRFGYEFDGWHNAYPPDKYILAYQYFVDKMRSEGVSNVAYVWHSWAVSPYYGTEDYPAQYPALESDQEVIPELWYPGDDYVDWVGLSIFGIGWGSLASNERVQWLLDFSVARQKAVMLAETAAIKTTGYSDTDWVIPNTTWFENVFDLCNENVVKAFTYINVDWEGDNPSSSWGDTRLQSAAPGVINYWLHNIEPFVHADSSLYDRIHYP